MSPSIAFDPTSSEAHWLRWNAPIVFASLVMLVVVFRMIWKNWLGSRRIAVIGVGIVLLLGLGSSYQYVHYHRKYTTYLQHTAPYQTVEGKVTTLRASPGKELKFEGFQVAGTASSCAGVGPPRRFHKPAVKGGPIHDGLAVRGSFDESCTVKLEVVKDSQWKCACRHEKGLSCRNVYRLSPALPYTGSPRGVQQISPRCILVSLSSA